MTNNRYRISPPAFPLHQRPLTFVPRSIFSILFVEIRLFSRKIVGVATLLLHVATPNFSPGYNERGAMPAHIVGLPSGLYLLTDHVRLVFPDLYALFCLKHQLIVGKHY
jgi:hypothetical protein